MLLRWRVDSTKYIHDAPVLRLVVRARQEPGLCLVHYLRLLHLEHFPARPLSAVGAAPGETEWIALPEQPGSVRYSSGGAKSVPRLACARVWDGAQGRKTHEPQTWRDQAYAHAVGGGEDVPRSEPPESGMQRARTGSASP